MKASSSILAAENITVGYAGRPSSAILFEHLSIQLHPRQLICFMGPNGIGKSSLIRTLSGLQEPLVGKVMNNQPHQLSVVLTDKVSATHMTVQELLTFGRYPYLNWNVQLTDEDHLAISNAINQTRIHHLLSKRLYELSDGQLQMCMLTKALAQNTPALLLDEPTAHLDLNNRVEIMNLLRRLSREEGKAILVATHELDLALQTADLIWLADNKTLITGLPEDLVLNGTFDEIFKFKGFDLKTGKVEHQPYRNMAVNLTGEGYEYLWTKNALERNGYSVVAAGTPLITVQKADQEISWQFNSQQYTSLHALLATLATT